MTRMAPKLHEYRSAIASFAALIVGVVIFLWLSDGTQFHQLAIGIMMSSVTLTVALALLELCWQVGLRAGFDSQKRNRAYEVEYRVQGSPVAAPQSQELPISVRWNTMPIAVMPITAAAIGRRISMDALTLLRRPCLISKSPDSHARHVRPTLPARSTA